MRLSTFVVLLLLFLFITTPGIHAQGQWPTSVDQNNYIRAHELLVSGNYPEAIAALKQLQKKIPYNISVNRDLAQAYYLSAQYAEAKAVLENVIKSKQADEQAYQIMVACMNALGEQQKAVPIIQNGIELYPHSGLLYRELGKLYESAGRTDDAIQAWITGAKIAPTYALNCYELCRFYSLHDKPVWVLLYGEIFLNMTQKSERSYEVKKMMINAYQSFFFMPDSSPKYGGGFGAPTANNFHDAVKNTLIKSASVMDDGVNMENLIMLRARFIMDWEDTYVKKYPFQLFAYQDTLLRYGYYDAYNQWLLGKTVNQSEFESWDKFHSSAIAQYLSWADEHPFKPLTTDFSDEKTDRISVIKIKK
jgi:tetratricopeptide (TPR) repeat protein